MLIDCDWYQIADGARLFTCDVGVPHFTAPELQGQSFRGLQRTPQHDAFGLAVLVFHLLFMGRHPFAGRYLGKGDMPVERAIKEGRFAYGPHADGVQMTPPPHSLRLSQVPDEIAGLFERAFQAAGWTAGPTERDRLAPRPRAPEGIDRGVLAAPRAHVREPRVRLSVVRHRPRRRSRSLRVGAGAGSDRSQPDHLRSRAVLAGRRGGAAADADMAARGRGLATAGAADPRRRDGMGVGHGDGRRRAPSCSSSCRS